MLVFEWNLNQLMVTDDASLVVYSEERLKQLVEEFGWRVNGGN